MHMQYVCCNQDLTSSFDLHPITWDRLDGQVLHLVWSCQLLASYHHTHASDMAEVPSKASSLGSEWIKGLHLGLDFHCHLHGQLQKGGTQIV